MKHAGCRAADAEEETVAHYLQQNPEFFERHLPLLARLRLPHARGSSTISLVERQMEVHARAARGPGAKLADFVRVARANDAVAEKLHRFTRRLLRAQTRQAPSSSSRRACARISTPSTRCWCSWAQTGGIPQRFVRVDERR